MDLDRVLDVLTKIMDFFTGYAEKTSKELEEINSSKVITESQIEYINKIKARTKMKLVVYATINVLLLALTVFGSIDAINLDIFPIAPAVVFIMGTAVNLTFAKAQVDVLNEIKNVDLTNKKDFDMEKNVIQNTKIKYNDNLRTRSSSIDELKCLRSECVNLSREIPNIKIRCQGNNEQIAIKVKKI